MADTYLNKSGLTYFWDKIKTALGLKVNQSDFDAFSHKNRTLVPDTIIPDNADLQTTEYLVIGKYYVGNNTNAATLVNCPTGGKAFMMEVISPISSTIDNETTATGVYRIRLITTYEGKRYIQKVNSSSTAGVYTYEGWKYLPNEGDVNNQIYANTNSKYGYVRITNYDASVGRWVKIASMSHHTRSNDNVNYTFQLDFVGSGATQYRQSYTFGVGARMSNTALSSVAYEWLDSEKFHYSGAPNLGDLVKVTRKWVAGTSSADHYIYFEIWVNLNSGWKTYWLHPTISGYKNDYSQAIAFRRNSDEWTYVNVNGTSAQIGQSTYLTEGYEEVSIVDNRKAISYLDNYYTTRPTTADTTPTGRGGLFTFKATSSMSEKPAAGDGHIIQMDWDGTNGYDSQIYVANNSGRLYTRGQNAGTWGDWKEFVRYGDSATFNNIAVTSSYPQIKGNGSLYLSSDTSWGEGNRGTLILANGTCRPSSSQNGTMDLGNASGRWKNLYLNGDIYKGNYTISLPSKNGTLAVVGDIPTKTSDLTNDGSDGNSTYVEADDLATVATTGSYNDLTNKPAEAVTIFYWVAPDADNKVYIYKDRNRTTQATFEEFKEAVLNSNVRLYQEYDADTFWISDVELVDTWIDGHIFFKVADDKWWEEYSWYDDDTEAEYTGRTSYNTQANWNIDDSSNPAYIWNKPTIPIVDSALSDSSTNAIQNKVVKAALDGKNKTIYTAWNISPDANTPASWKTKLGGEGIYWTWYNTTGKFTNQPSQYGMLRTVIGDGDVRQDYYVQTSGKHYYRCGNVTGWWGKSGDVGAFNNISNNVGFNRFHNNTGSAVYKLVTVVGDSSNNTTPVGITVFTRQQTYLIQGMTNSGHVGYMVEVGTKFNDKALDSSTRHCRLKVNGQASSSTTKIYCAIGAYSYIDIQADGDITIENSTEADWTAATSNAIYKCVTTPTTLQLGTGATGSVTFSGNGDTVTLPVTDVKDSYITWGGKGLYNGPSPDDAGCIDEFGHNKLAFLPAECIDVAYSIDGGTTWVDYGLSDSQKMSLVTLSQKVQSGGSTTATAENITDLKLRVRIATAAKTATGSGSLYTAAKKILFNVNDPNSDAQMTMRYRTIANYKADVDTWTNVSGTWNVRGGSGWNSIPFNYRFGGNYTNQTSQIGQFEFVFSNTKLGTWDSKKVWIDSIRLIGDTNWAMPSELARAGTIYTWNINKEVTFPAQISTPRIACTGTNYPHIRGNSNNLITFSANGGWTSGSGAICLEPTKFRPSTADSGTIDLGQSSATWKNFYLSGNIIKGSYTYTLPNQTGTVALISDVPAKVSDLSNTSGGFITYCTCTSAAADTTKVVTIDSGDSDWVLRKGTLIAVKYSNTNSASNVTLNVGGTGAKSVYYNTGVNTGSSSNIFGYANRTVFYLYDGTNWVWISDSRHDGNDNTIPSAYCSTAAGTAAKTASMSGYVLTANRYTVITFTNANSSASALTLNINSKGAKPLYINGNPSSTTNYTLPAGQYIIWYDGTNYYVYTSGNIPRVVTAENPISAVSITNTVSGSNITDGSITFDKTASGEFVKLETTTVDPGEGVTLAPNTLLAVYDVLDDYRRGEVLVSTQNVDTLATTSDVAVIWSSGTWTQFGRMASSSNKHILTIANPTDNNWTVEISLDCPSVLPGSVISGSSVITTTPATGIAELDSNNAISKVITWSRIASRGSVYNRKYVTIPANTTKKFCACVCTYQTTAAPTGTWEGGDEITGTSVGAGFGGPSCTLTATLIDNGE